jgi:pyruvate/2-oxoglutarate dehydrogenase complex dihydrolipoamide acyltransferase (E2) component
MRFPALRFPKLSFLKQRKLTRKEILRAGAPIAVLALIASVVVGRERPAEPVVEPASRIQPRIEAREPDLDLSQLVRPADAAAEKPAADPFARHSFAPQAQADAAAAQPAAPPAAPPLPFRYLGKMIEDGELAVFLARGDESYSVKAEHGKKQGKNRGQKLDGEYRVDKVTENRVTFTYLPLKIQQTLEIPAVN